MGYVTPIPTHPTSGVGGPPRVRPGSKTTKGQAFMAGQKIRIRLKAYDLEVIDSSARKIVETA